MESPSEQDKSYKDPILTSSPSLQRGHNGSSSINTSVKQNPFKSKKYDILSNRDDEYPIDNAIEDYEDDDLSDDMYDIYDDDISDTHSISLNNIDSTNVPKIGTDNINSVSATLEETSPIPAPEPTTFKEKLVLFFKTKILHPFRTALEAGMTVHLMSLTITFGIIGGLFPVPGFTALICLLFGIIFKLNIPLMQVINLILTPLDLALSLPLMRVGEHILGREPIPLSLKQLMDKVKDDGLKGTIKIIMMAILCAILGWLLMSVIIGPIIYYICRPIVRHIMRKRGMLRFSDTQNPDDIPLALMENNQENQNQYELETLELQDLILDDSIPVDRQSVTSASSRDYRSRISSGRHRSPRNAQARTSSSPFSRIPAESSELGRNNLASEDVGGRESELYRTEDEKLTYKPDVEGEADIGAMASTLR